MKRLCLATVAILMVSGCGLKTYDTGLSSGTISSGVEETDGGLSYSNGDRYQGDVRDGAPHGNGVMTFQNGDIYNGEFQQGKMHGSGELKYVHGARYVGEFSNEKITNGGTLTLKDGSVFVGDFSDDGAPTKGTVTFKDGVQQTGEFTLAEDSNLAKKLVEKSETDRRISFDGKKLSLKQGTQKFVFKGSNATYEGGFSVIGFPNGWGSVTADKNDWYVLYIEGEPFYESFGPRTISQLKAHPKCRLNKHGQDFVFAQGSCRQGEANGEGTIVSLDGKRTITGSFKNGALVSGKEKTAIANNGYYLGRTYAGYWKKFKYHGEGSHRNGLDRFNGIFANGKRHGAGYCKVEGDGINKPCKWNEGRRVDSSYLAQVQQQKQIEKEEACKTATEKAERAVKQLEKTASDGICREELQDIFTRSAESREEHYRNCVFLKRRYYPWDGRDVKAAVKTSSTLSCPQNEYVASLGKLGESISETINSSQKEINSLIDEAIQAEKQQRAQYRRDKAEERARSKRELWAGIVGSFTESVQSVSAMKAENSRIETALSAKVAQLNRRNEQLRRQAAQQRVAMQSKLVSEQRAAAEKERLRRESQRSAAAKRQKEEAARQARLRAERQRPRTTTAQTRGQAETTKVLPRKRSMPRTMGSSIGSGSGNKQGKLTRRNLTVGSCKISSMTVAYEVSSIFGEPLVKADYQWNAPAGGAKDCLPHDFSLWLTIQSGSHTGYIRVSPVIPKAGAGWSFSGTPGSPNWNKYICGFNGQGVISCFDKDKAKAIHKTGDIVGFELSHR